MANVLEVVDLRTEFHLRSANVGAVDGVSFTVGEGECVGLVGESGCGKTTTGLSIMKLLPNVGHVTRGSMTLLGRDLVPMPEKVMREVRGNDVAMIFQDPMTSLNPTMTIGRQIAEPVRIHRRSPSRRRRTGRSRCSSSSGCPARPSGSTTYPHQLSGGLRQRVMIAIALACEPKLLIADEPTTALDVTIQAQILDLIDDLRERLRMAVLLITHDMGVIAGRTDRVMVMYAGKIVEGGVDAPSCSPRCATPTPRHCSTRSPSSRPTASSRSTASLASRPTSPRRRRLPVRARAAAYATDECRDEEPPLDRSRARTTSFACFHPVGRTPRPERHRVVDTRSEKSRPTGARVAASSLLKIEHLVKEFPSPRARSCSARSAR